MIPNHTIRYGLPVSRYVYIDNYGNPWGKWNYDFIAGQIPNYIPAGNLPTLPSIIAPRFCTFQSLFGGYRYKLWLPDAEQAFDFTKLEFGFGGRIYKPWLYQGELNFYTEAELLMLWTGAPPGEYFLEN